jgi:hypothetical protein
MGDFVVKRTNIATLLALGALPLALTVGCDLLKGQKQQTKEEILAEFQAEQAEQAEKDRADRLEAELADIKEQQAANDAAATKQARDEQVASLERQLAAQRQRAAQAAKEAEEAKAAAAQQPQSNRPRRGEGRDTGAAGGQQVARMSVVNVPQGTKVAVSISGTLSTDTHKTGDPWEGTLAQAVAADGATIWSAGARVAGVVSASAPTGRLANGQGTLAIKLNEVGGSAIDGGIYAITGDSKGARNAKVIGTTAALGALAGILSDKNNRRDHALAGAAAGAAAGTALAAGSATTVITMQGTVTFSLPSAERVTLRNR